MIPIVTRYLCLAELKSQLFGLHIWVPHLPVVPACIPFYVQDLYQGNDKSLNFFLKFSPQNARKSCHSRLKTSLFDWVPQERSSSHFSVIAEGTTMVQGVSVLRTFRKPWFALASLFE